MSMINFRLGPPWARFAGAASAALVLAASAGKLAAAPVGYVYYLQTFGDWTVTCGRDESSGRDNCTLSAPPPDRHGDSQIEIGNGQGDNDAIIVRVRGALMQESPLYLRVDAKSPHQTQPNRFGEGRWNGDEAETIIAELNSGQRAVVRSFAGPPPSPRDAFFSLDRFDEALTDFDRRTSGKPAAETAQATAPEQTASTDVPTAPPAVAPPPPEQTQPTAEPEPEEPQPAAEPAAGEQREPQPQPQLAPNPTQRPGSTSGAVTILDESRIGRARLTSNVVNREPVDELGATMDIPAAGQKAVFFFTEVRGMAGRNVTHRWLRDGNVMASVPFPIGSDRWRVYSRKVIGGNETGSWTVIAVGSDGGELARAAFTVE